MLKKTITIIIAALMICSMAACGSSDNKKDSGSSSGTSSSASGNTDSSSDNGSSAASDTSSDNSSSSVSDTSTAAQGTEVKAEYTPNTNGLLTTTDIFSNRDLLQTPELSNATKVQASDGKTETITEEGIYILTGTANNFTVKVEAAKDAKVQLVLDNFNITNESTPVIYVVSADKCFVTTSGNESKLSVTGEFTADGDSNTDAVIYSKDDIVLNGTGTLTISSSDNGISGKDTIKITGGTYNITTTKDSIEAKDSILICGGTFNINTSKDGLHCENSDDDSLGYIYIYGGSFKITAKADAIQTQSAVQIDGGTFDITASEGIEATYVQINDGTISISASDDGINASSKSKAYSTPTFEMNGGTLTIVMGQGDTDAIDANGNIVVNGGKIDITAQVSSFDYDGTAEFNGGTIIINGSQVDSIPHSMMGGGRGGMMR